MSIHTHLLNAEAAFRIVCFGFFDDLNHMFDVLVVGNKGHDEPDVVADDNEERYANEKNQVNREG